MTLTRFDTITRGYSKLKIAVLGDFCLDRYLEIDPARKEVSIETGLAVHNVVNVRAQPGGAGTVLNNLGALGVGKIFPIGFCGEEGEGYELQQALSNVPSVSLENFFATSQRRTFTYTKPLILRHNQTPQELNRFDLKNWTPTPLALRRRLADAVRRIAARVDAIIVLNQSDIADTGVVSKEVLEALHAVAKTNPKLLILADSRRRLRKFPLVALKMNRAELSAFTGAKRPLDLEQTKAIAAKLAKKNGHPIFVTLAEEGIVGALPSEEVVFAPALKVRGEIDVVGAGDSVTANLVTTISSGAFLLEALEIANAAASVVVHKLGTTGTASIRELKQLLQSD